MKWRSILLFLCCCSFCLPFLMDFQTIILFQTIRHADHVKSFLSFFITLTLYDGNFFFINFYLLTFYVLLFSKYLLDFNFIFWFGGIDGLMCLARQMWLYWCLGLGRGCRLIDPSSRLKSFDSPANKNQFPSREAKECFIFPYYQRLNAEQNGCVDFPFILFT